MTAKRSDAIVARTIQRAAEQMAQEYREERGGDAERLYEGISAVIEEQRPNVEVLLFVLEILKHGLLEQKSRELFPAAGESATVVHPHDHAPPAIPMIGVADGVEKTTLLG